MVAPSLETIIGSYDGSNSDASDNDVVMIEYTDSEENWTYVTDEGPGDDEASQETVIESDNDVTITDYTDSEENWAYVTYETYEGHEDDEASQETVIESHDEVRSDASDDDEETIRKNYIDVQGNCANQEKEATQADWSCGWYTYKYSKCSWSDEYVDWSYKEFSWANGSNSWTQWQSSCPQAYPNPQHQEQPLANAPRKITYNEEDTINRLGKEKKELEEKSSINLLKALELSTDTDTDLIFFINGANFFLDYKGVDSSPRGAADAVKTAWRALGLCKRKTELHEALDAAVKAIRDVLSLRTQLASLPLGNKKKYCSVLQAAWGEPIDDEENSRLMQSYRKSVWDKFPGAFPSNNKKENIQRGGPRPRRERNRESRPRREAETVAKVITPPPGLEDVVQWQ